MCEADEKIKALLAELFRLKETVGLKAIDVPNPSTLLITIEPNSAMPAWALIDFCRALHDSRPSEVGVTEDGRLRLWWD